MGSNDRLDCPVCIRLVVPQYQTAEAIRRVFHTYDSMVYVKCTVCKLQVRSDRYRLILAEAEATEEE